MAAAQDDRFRPLPTGEGSPNVTSTIVLVDDEGNETPYVAADDSGDV